MTQQELEALYQDELHRCAQAHVVFNDFKQRNQPILDQLNQLERAAHVAPPPPGFVSCSTCHRWLVPERALRPNRYFDKQEVAARCPLCFAALVVDGHFSGDTVSALDVTKLLREDQPDVLFHAHIPPEFLCSNGSLRWALDYEEDLTIHGWLACAGAKIATGTITWGCEDTAHHSLSCALAGHPERTYDTSGLYWESMIEALECFLRCSFAAKETNR